MRNNRSLFFIIIGLALLVTVGVLLLEQLGIYTLPSRSVAKTPIQVAVPTDLADWANGAADTFNSRNSDATVTIISVNGLPAINQFGRTNVTDLPHAWMPEATFVAAIAAEEGIAFETTGESIIQTDMSWGGFESRTSALGALNWEIIHNASEIGAWSELGGDPNWQYFKMTLASPANSAEGLAALISASASYHQTDLLSTDLVREPALRAWLSDIVQSVPNFNTLGSDPAGAMANRGTSAGEVGFLATSSWNRSRAGLNNREPFVIQPAQYNVELDYPYVLRNRLESNEADVAARFGNFLQQQSDALNDRGFGATSTTTPIQVDGSAALALLQWAEIEIRN